MTQAQIRLEQKHHEPKYHGYSDILCKVNDEALRVKMLAKYNGDSELMYRIKQWVAEKNGIDENDWNYNNSRISRRDRYGNQPQMIRYCDMRKIAMYLIYEYCKNISLAKVGKIFNGKHHSTVINAIRKVKEAIYAEDEYTLDLVHYIESKIELS